MITLFSEFGLQVYPLKAYIDGQAEVMFIGKKIAVLYFLVE